MIKKLATSAQRSRIMSSIRGKNTRPERILRSSLFARGFRYRIHAKELPGTPDLVFPKYRAAVFVHGCFWHRHRGCRYATTPRTNEKFWKEKLEKNVERDRCHEEKLLVLGWRVAVVWECALKHSPEDTVGLVGKWLHGGDRMLVVGQSDSARERN